MFFYSHSLFCLLADVSYKLKMHHGTSDLSICNCLLEIRFVGIFLLLCSVIAACLFHKNKEQGGVWGESQKKLFLSLKLPITKSQHFQSETFLEKFEPEGNCCSRRLKLQYFLIKVLTQPYLQAEAVFYTSYSFQCIFYVLMVLTLL